MLTILLTCPTTGRPVELKTLDWRSEVDGENEVIHYRADCACGSEHFGFMTERFAALHASVEA